MSNYVEMWKCPVRSGRTGTAFADAHLPRPVLREVFYRNLSLLTDKSPGIDIRFLQHQNPFHRRPICDILLE